MRVAIDSGGTFTDAVFVAGGGLRLLKVPSTPRNPANAITDILARICTEFPDAARAGALELLYGTTVGTNALLERRGGRVALVTTAGFEDVLVIGRQARPRLYDWFVDRPEPLVPASRRLGLRERVGPGGAVLLRPSPRELGRIARAARQCGAEAVAVCLLFSYANPAHERAAGAALQAAGLPVTLSCDVLPEFREFERTSTTVVNAYLLPLMGNYLRDVSRRAAAAWVPARQAARKNAGRVRVMQSNGGIISAFVAAREPVRTILSGPAGGVLGAEFAARAAGFQRVISFDMGGTSTDVALLDGTPRTTNEAVVAGFPVAVSVLDIHTVGAGGGSLARFDRAGALRVGPESAGADPGPACYGRGERATVTDAQLVLRRISPASLLGGEFRLDSARARRALQALLRSAPRGAARRGGLRTVEDLAQGIVDVANAAMEKAIRVISIERGHDPRDYTLVAFGGAGGLHGCDLAAALRLPQVLVPRLPGGLSALGILRADVAKEYVRTVQLPARSPGTARSLAAAFAAMERNGLRELAREGHRGPAQVRVERMLDCRYTGQGYELTIPVGRGFYEFVGAFHRAHEQRYGYSDPTRPLEVVNVRVRMAGLTPKPAVARARLSSASPAAAREAVDSIFVGGRGVPAAYYRRERLRAGNRLRGPAVVTEYGATTFVPPGWTCRVDSYGNLLLWQEKK